ncbi:zinc-binding alcohol dehydrogenase [candidate division KSB1 bacterium]|nr:zinc-binding alcohol dehydrogenase [candidate division KSB1 bacterium]
MFKRKIAVINGKGEVLIKEESVPQLSHNQTLIEVHHSLVSAGTEILNIVARRKNPDASQADLSAGYSTAGIVKEVAGESNWLKPGMRVMAMGANGAHHADYVCVPNNLIVPVPDALPFEEAVYACLAATAMQAIHRAELKLGEYGAVLGLGCIGNLAAQLAQLNGARVIGWDALPSRLEIARKCGINHTANYLESDAVQMSQIFSEPYGLEFALLAFGGNGTEAIRSLMSCMMQSADGHLIGRIISIGAIQFELQGGARMGNMDIRFSSRTGPGYHDPEYEYGADYPKGFVPFTTQRNLRELLRLMAEKRLLVTPLTTHFMPLEKYPEIIERVLDDPNQVLGVVLNMER